MYKSTRWQEQAAGSIGELWKVWGSQCKSKNSSISNHLISILSLSKSWLIWQKRLIRWRGRILKKRRICNGAPPYHVTPNKDHLVDHLVTSSPWHNNHQNSFNFSKWRKQTHECMVLIKLNMGNSIGKSHDQVI